MEKRFNTSSDRIFPVFLVTPWLGIIQNLTQDCCLVNRCFYVSINCGFRSAYSLTLCSMMLSAS
jgi:hypothetical protein